MKSNPKILAQLNQLLAQELVGINQFFLHARIYKNWGLEGLNQRDYHQSIRAMKQADRLMERILFLEGLPNLQELGRLLIGEDCPEMLACDLKFQSSCRQELQKAVAFFEKEQDYLSRELAEDLLEHCEEHIDWLETQQGLIQSLGLENYLQSRMSKGD